MQQIGIIGLDTSHVVRFCELLNSTDASYDARIACAVAGGSPNFSLSHKRLPKFTRKVHDECSVPLFDHIKEMPENLDAIIIGSVDARQHLDQFEQICTRGIPVFINKPLTASISEAEAIDALSKKWNSPVFSASGMRFAERLTQIVRTIELEEIVGADLYCPMEMIEELPGYFWYGVHAIEIAYLMMGNNCRRVKCLKNQLTDIVTAEWGGGRYVTLRGQRSNNYSFGGSIHLENQSIGFQIDSSEKPYYQSQLEAILEFNKTRISPVPEGQTLEIIRFITAANTSRRNGEFVYL